MRSWACAAALNVATQNATGVSYTVNFTASALPVSARYVIDFPPGTGLAAVTNASVTSTSLTGATFIVTVTGTTLQIDKSGGTALAAEAHNLTIANVTNPPKGSYKVHVQTGDQVPTVIDNKYPSRAGPSRRPLPRGLGWRHAVRYTGAVVFSRLFAFRSGAC